MPPPRVLLHRGVQKADVTHAKTGSEVNVSLGRAQLEDIHAPDQLYDGCKVHSAVPSKNKGAMSK